MPHVKLGNAAPVSVRRAEDGSEQRLGVELPEDTDHAVTDVHVPDGTPLGEALQTITAAGGVWPYHSDDEAPLWVSSDDKSLATLLADHFGCEVKAWRTAAKSTAPGEPSEPDTDE